MNQRELLYLAGGLVAGAVGGYFIAKSRLTAEFELLTQEAVDDVKRNYKAIYKTDMESPAEARLKYEGKVKELGYIEDVEVDVKSVVKPPSVPIPPRLELDGFKEDVTEEEMVKIEKAYEGVHDSAVKLAHDDTEWKWMLEHRDPDSPYLITNEEFSEERPEFDKYSLVFYEEDDVLCENDRPLDDIEDVVGEASLTLFGKGSNDDNIVYVRNERLQIDYEITRDKRAYTTVVLALPEEKAGVDRFREDD